MLGFAASQIGACPFHLTRPMKLKDIIPGRQKTGCGREPQLIEELEGSRPPRLLCDDAAVLAGVPAGAGQDPERPNQESEDEIEPLAGVGWPPETVGIGLPDGPRWSGEMSRPKEEIGHQCYCSAAAKDGFTVPMQRLAQRRPPMRRLRLRG